MAESSATMKLLKAKGGTDPLTRALFFTNKTFIQMLFMLCGRKVVSFLISRPILQFPCLILIHIYILLCAYMLYACMFTVPTSYEFGLLPE